MTLLDTALAAHDAGLCVLPAAADGSKRPAADWKPFQKTRPTRNEVVRWFVTPDDGPHHEGLGYVCGAVSGNLEMVEIEGRARHLEDELKAAARACGLGDVYDRIAAGYTEISPSGGIHWLYRCTEPVEGNLKLARRPGDTPGTVDVLIETRGEGGWVVAAPSRGSTHPTGLPWTMRRGGVATIATITADERRAFLDLCRMFDRMPETTAAPRISLEDDRLRGPGAAAMMLGDLRPGDVFMASTDWSDLLEPEGWTLVYERDGARYWRRPGKHFGVSAVTNGTGTDRLKVFTSSTQFDNGDGVTYDKLRAHAVLHHGGDFAAAVRSVTPDRPPTLAPARVAAASLPDPGAQPVHEPDDGLWLPEPLSWPELWSGEYKDEDWLAEPLLVRERIHALYAGAKTGKSLLVLDVVTSLALGQPTLRQPAGTPIDVLYLDYEMTRGDIQQRLALMGYDERTDLARLHYYLIPGLDGLDTAIGARQVGRLIDRHRAQLVVIDTTGRSMDGEENEADTMRDWYKHTGYVLKSRRVTALRIDHAGKDVGKGQRGTSAKNDDVDVVWQLTAAADQLTLKPTHQRVGYLEASYFIERHQDPLRHVMTAPTWPEGTAEAAAMLDRLGVDIEAGRPTARAAINRWNEAHEDDLGARITVANELLSAALKWRRSGLGLRTVDPDSTFSTGCGPVSRSADGVSQNCTSDVRTGGADSSGQVSGDSTDSCPPLKGGQRPVGGVEDLDSGSPLQGALADLLG